MLEQALASGAVETKFPGFDSSFGKLQTKDVPGRRPGPGLDCRQVGRDRQVGRVVETLIRLQEESCPGHRQDLPELRKTLQMQARDVGLPRPAIG